MAKSTENPNVPSPCDRLQEIAVILAEGYLRLVQIQKSSPRESGQSGKKEGQEMSHK